MTTPLSSLYDIQIKTSAGEMQSMSQYKGQVLLIVNTASECGFTPQYDGLETLHRKFKTKGFTVLAFPCNQFGAQEPGTDNEIAQFCALKFNTTFPVFAKIEVNGANAHPLFEHLKKSKKGLLGTEGIKWNFTKFLVNKEGEVVGRFAPNAEPSSLEKEISALL